MLSSGGIVDLQRVTNRTALPEACNLKPETYFSIFGSAASAAHNARARSRPRSE